MSLVKELLTDISENQKRIFALEERRVKTEDRKARSLETIVLYLHRLAEHMGIPKVEEPVEEEPETFAGEAVESVAVEAAPEVFPEIETGVHLHSTNVNWQQKIDAALHQGCMRFDGALKGIGGCPMADDELVGNMDSELMIPYFKELGYCKEIDAYELAHSIKLASEIFV